MEIFLTRLEVQELTGFQKCSRIKKHLDEQGIIYFENRFGWPLISREYLSKRHIPIMRFDQEKFQAQSPYANEPDFSALV